MTGIASLSLFVAATAQQKTQEPTTQQPDQKERANKLGQQGEKTENDQASSEQNQRTELPEVFKQLDLNEQQQEKILTIYRESDQKAEEVWNRVQDLHREAISMEAAAIAAARLENHDHDAHATNSAQPDGTNAVRRPNQAAGRTAQAAIVAPSDKDATAQASSTAETGEKRGAGKSDAEKVTNARKTNRREKHSADESKSEDESPAEGWSAKDGDLNIVAIRVGIAQPDGRVREYLLTQPNSKSETDADPAFSTHSSRLSQVWKDIHDGHEELVECEANTIVQVEAQLTEAQLQKLDETQSQASNTSKDPNDDSRR
jgi:hypothetical protein